jgi:hypothetical protein
MKRRCPRCANATIPIAGLALFRRPNCSECGARVRFHLVFELVFHILINMPVALAALFLIFTRGVIVGVLVGFVSLFVLAFLAATVAPQPHAASARRA